MRAVDLFAGPGGWDLPAAALGIEVLGVEWDDAACATRRAAGLWTLQADVALLDPMATVREHFPDGQPIGGVIASPPCQAFSMAGKGAGRKAIKALRVAIEDMAVGAGRATDRAWLDEECSDLRARLVLEPLRWALALKPRWIACEQVEPVLPLWEKMGQALRRHGYATWAGVLSSECFGVPQTRRRAFLIASLDGPVRAPAATHQRYVPPRRRDAGEGAMGLFDAPEPERIVHPEDRELLPWVSMAEALGWGMTARPSNTVAARKGDGGGAGLDGGSGARRVHEHAQDAGEWSPRDRVGFPRRADSGAAVDIEGTEYRDRDLRPASQPAFALTEKSRSWVRFRATNDRPNATERDVDSPAPALAFEHNAPSWIVNTPIDAPAPTVTSRSDRWQIKPDWTDDRPATTVAGDSRVWPPGHKVNSDDIAAGRDGYGDRAGTDAVRVTLAEALVLQSFPPDYPVQGTKTKQFEQVGNAVPPGLAFAVLLAVLSVAS